MPELVIEADLMRAIMRALRRQLRRKTLTVRARVRLHACIDVLYRTYVR